MEKETQKQQQVPAALGAPGASEASVIERRSGEREIDAPVAAHGALGHGAPGHDAPGHGPGREGGEERERPRRRPVARERDRAPVEPTSRLRFEIPDEVIERLASRDRTAFRRLTEIKGPRVESLDPVVQRALEDTVRKYRRTGAEAREVLSSKWLNDAEAVTANLNKRALPVTTRLLLSQPGVYETLLLRAIEEGVGRESVDVAPHEHEERGQGHEHRHSAK
jgi:hypothetical protein